MYGKHLKDYMSAEKYEMMKQHMSDSLKGHCVTPETRMKIGIKNKVSHKGKKLSEEHKKHISESIKGRKLSNKHKKQLSDARTGKIFINNKIQNKVIDKNELNYFVKNGWKRGMKPRNISNS